MTRARFPVGTVLWVGELSFAGKPGGKQAPGVVLSSPKYHELRPDVIVARITSKMHHAAGFGAVAIHDWKHSGLDTPSVIKPFLITVDRSQILRVAGELDPQTLADLKTAFKSIFPLAN
jgi:mRNA-degrading endonuclease toxin of MazEF toxin-antitoxin module